MRGVTAADSEARAQLTSSEEQSQNEWSNQRALGPLTKAASILALSDSDHAHGLYLCYDCSH